MNTRFVDGEIETPKGLGRSRRSRLCLAALVLLLLAAPCAGREGAGSQLFVVGTHPNTLVLFDSGRDEIVAQIPTKGRAPKEIIPSADGRRVYVTTEARENIEVVNLATRKVEDVIQIAPPGYRVKIYGLALSRKGDRLYAHVKPVQRMLDEYRVEPPQIWDIDLRTHESRKIVEVPQGVATLLAPSDARRLIAWGRDIYVIDLELGRIIETHRLLTARAPGQPRINTLPFFVQFEQSGIFSCPYFATDPITNRQVFGLANLEVDTGKLDLMELGPPIPSYSSVVSPDRKRAYVVMNQLVLVDLTSKRILEVRDVERTKYVANITRDGKKLYLPSSGPFFDVYDTETLKLIKRVELPGDPSVGLLRALPEAPAR